MLNLDKINSDFDLKDLDAEKILKLIIEHQNSIIKLVLLIGVLLIGGGMFNDYHRKGQVLQVQMTKAQEKLDVIKSRKTALDELKKFKSSVSKNLSESELITLISEYAKSHNVAITSLSPGESKDMGLYDNLSVSFQATSDSFKNLLLFLRKIEKSDFPIMVDSWTGQEEEKGKINFGIKVSAVLIHT